MVGTLEFERWRLEGISLLAAVVAYYANLSRLEDLHELFEATVSPSAIMVGFVLTAKAILLSISQKETVRRLKENGTWIVLVEHMTSGIYYALALTMMSCGLMLARFKEPEAWHQLAVSAWAFFLTMTLLVFIQIVRLLAQILKTA